MRHLFLIVALAVLLLTGCGIDNIQWAQINGIKVIELSVPAAEFKAQYGKDGLAVVNHKTNTITYHERYFNDLCVRDAEYGKIRNKLEGLDYNKYAFPCARLEFGEWVEYGRVK